MANYCRAVTKSLRGTRTNIVKKKTLKLHALSVRVPSICTNDIYIVLLLISSIPPAHGLINYKHTKAKCRHPKNWPVTELCGRCVMCIWVYRLEIQWVTLVFSTQLCDLLPLSPSLWFNSPRLSSVNKYTVYKSTVCKGGGGMEFCASDI